MKFHLITAVILCFILSGCTLLRSPDRYLPHSKNIIQKDLDLYDQSRSRSVPVALYFSDTTASKKVIIFSHGYGGNKGGDNLAYTYLTTYLAQIGYYVVSIQHELPNDDLLPMTGNLRETRAPNWERGAQNILFVMNTLKKTHPKLDLGHLTLIGHSNGGDMSVLFAHKYPELVEKVISLDNRRMPLPLTDKPRILTLRSSDQPADEGVLPSSVDKIKYRIQVIDLPDTKHGDMDDKGSSQHHAEINRYIMRFLKG